jgi:hypothetical protein
MFGRTQPTAKENNMTHVGKAFGIFALLSLFAVSANATSTVTITTVGCQTDGHCFAGVTPTITGSGCADGSQIRFDTSVANPGARAMYEAALAAMLAGKTVVVQTAACLDTFVQPSWIYVNR